MKEEKNSLMGCCTPNIGNTHTQQRERKREKKGNALEVKGDEGKKKLNVLKKGRGPAIVDEGSYDRTG
jgi:hypothetical protein